jgi:alpha-beta hydrolase superfamily lysophospholipase
MPSSVSAVAGHRRSPGYADPPGYAPGAGTHYWPSRDVGHPPRASVVVIPGRGETPALFENVAFRLALDGYPVTLLGPGEESVSTLGELRIPDLPFVLMGSDTGALRALVLAGSPALRLDALVLLGLPLLYRPVDGEVPVEAPPRALPDIPILLVHGEDDEVSPLSLVRMTTRTAPRAHLEVVSGGHQVLDGPGHRCVAAQTLLFLEGLRADFESVSAAGGEDG